jgi:hypothetical protein
MKRTIISGLTILISSLTLASAAMASQTTIHDLAADLNGDGVVNLGELVDYNRDQRGS